MRRLLALGATLVVALVGLLPSAADGASTAPAFPPQRPTRVLVLGDSVMKGAATVYATKLPGREVVVDAEVNRSTGQGADVVARLGTDWDVVVVLLGHNDGGTPGAYQPAARSILDQLSGVRMVSWLTIHEVRPYYPAVNDYIASLQPSYPNLRIGDWNAIADANPDALAADGLHLNGTGADLMADLVANQVQIAELEWLAALKALATTTTTTTTAPPTTTTASTTTTAPPTTTTAMPTTVEVPEPTGATPPSDDASKEDGPNLLVRPVPIIAVVAAGSGIWWFRRRRRRRQIEADLS